MDATPCADNQDSGALRLSELLKELEIENNWRWAYDHFEDTIQKITKRFTVRDVCELGGGRTPFFARERIEQLGLRYVVNDISSAELDRAPAWVDKACFDVSAANAPKDFENSFDLVFSHMLMEHVSDGRAAHQNILKMLKPGGLYFHFHPVLYSPPLVFNWLMPEIFTKKILLFLQPHRHDDGYPKFPARYSYCTISERTRSEIANIGFRAAYLVPFYGNDYLKRLPPLQRLEDALSTYALRAKKTYLASLCYSIGMK